MEARSQKSIATRCKSANEATRDRWIGIVAARQLRLVTMAQLRSAGLSRGAVQNRIGRGRLVRLRHGVYATHPPPYSLQQRWMAAVLACGPGALLSDWPAAAHWDIATPDPTLLAPQVDQIELERMLVAAESLKLLNRPRLTELALARASRPGARNILPLIAQSPALTASDLELLFLPVLRAAEVPRPLFNHPIRVPTRDKPLKVDLAWPDLRLVVELDSQRWHGDWERAEIDRDRDQLLALAGHLCHRFFRRRIAEDPATVARRLRALVDLRR